MGGSVAHAPGRGGGPTLQFARCPFVRFVLVTRGAGVRDAGLLGLCRSDEAKRVGGDGIVFDGLLDGRHMARSTLAARAVRSVVRMFADGPFQPGGIILRVAAETESIAPFSEIRLVLVAVNLMAVEAANLAVVHVALHEIIALHPVLMGS